VLAAVVTVRLLGGERGALLALLVGALPLVLLAAYPLLVAAVLLRSGVLQAAAVLLIGAHVVLVAPSLRAAPVPDVAADVPRLRVVVANLYVRNPEPERAGAALRALRPDVLVVPELDGRGLVALRSSGLLADLPYRVTQQDVGQESVGLFSRRPLRDLELRRVGGRVLPRATVEVGGVPVRLLAAHPLPPLGGLGPLWRVSLQDLAAEAARLGLPAVVAGDLNADRDHAAFRGLLDAGLRDAHDEVGRGLARTWPAGLPLLHLDHVLVRDAPQARLVPLAVREVDVPGSDHRGVVADLAVVAG